MPFLVTSTEDAESLVGRVTTVARGGGGDRRGGGRLIRGVSLKPGGQGARRVGIKKADGYKKERMGIENLRGGDCRRRTKEKTPGHSLPNAFDSLGALFFPSQTLP